MQRTAQLPKLSLKNISTSANKQRWTENLVYGIAPLNCTMETFLAFYASIQSQAQKIPISFTIYEDYRKISTTFYSPLRQANEHLNVFWSGYMKMHQRLTKSCSGVTKSVVQEFSVLLSTGDFSIEMFKSFLHRLQARSQVVYRSLCCIRGQFSIVASVALDCAAILRVPWSCQGHFKIINQCSCKSLQVLEDHDSVLQYTGSPIITVCISHNDAFMLKQVMTNPF